MNFVALFAGLTIGFIFGFAICALLVAGKMSDLRDKKYGKGESK